MHGYNVIVVYSQNQQQILMCKRKKNPYQGLLNLLGGKIEDHEDGLRAAYRELYEESNISNKDIELIHLMDFKYYLADCYLEVYVGQLSKDVKVVAEVNELIWVDAKNNDFFSMHEYAGEGNIGHIIEQVNLYKQQLFAK